MTLRHVLCIANNMDNKKDKRRRLEKEDLELNSDWQGVDKAPGEEKGKKEKVAKNDLKGKKGDGDPTQKEDQPLK